VPGLQVAIRTLPIPRHVAGRHYEQWVALKSTPENTTIALKRDDAIALTGRLLAFWLTLLGIASDSYEPASAAAQSVLDDYTEFLPTSDS